MGLTNNTGKLSNTLTSNGTQITLGGSTVTDSNLLNIIGNQSTVNVGVVFNNTNGTYPKIYGLQNVNNNFVLYDYSSSATRLTIASSGNVGIGTSSPSTLLHLNATTTQLTLQNTDGGTNAERVGFFMTGGDTFKLISLNDNNTTRVDNILVANVLTGNVGIGTSSPTSLLHAYSSTTGTQVIANFAAANYGSSSSRTYIQIGTQYGDGSSRIGSINTTGNQSALVFQTQSASSGVFNDAMYINGSGNVGIGTSSPSALLHVAGSAPYIHIQPTSGSRYIDIGNWDASTNFMEAGGGGLYIKTQQAYDLLFGTNAAERMRITTQTGDANVCIGATSAPQANAGRGSLTMNGSSTSIVTMAVGGNEKGYMYHNGSSLIFNNSAGGTLSMSNGTGGVYLAVNATSWTANSDERLKDITGNIENAVDSLMTLRAVKHTWKADIDKVEKLALIAQDVEVVFPQVIDKGKLPSNPNEEQTDETEYLGVRYTELIPVLVAAIQELSAKVTALENR